MGLVNIIACDEQLAGEVDKLENRSSCADSFQSGHHAGQLDEV